jgi:hypothetical protein
VPLHSGGYATSPLRPNDNNRAAAAGGGAGLHNRKSAVRSSAPAAIVLSSAVASSGGGGGGAGGVGISRGRASYEREKAEKARAEVGGLYNCRLQLTPYQ